MWNRRFAPLAAVVAALAVLLASACGSSGSPAREEAEPAAAREMLVGPTCKAGERVVAAPPAAGLYHAAMPSLLDTDARSGSRSSARVQGFQRLAGRKLAWVYFSDNWFGGRISFPRDAVDAIRRDGAMPFIRLMPRSSWVDRRRDERFGLARIRAGRFDAQLRRWARAARDTRLPMLVDFAPEMNGNWFPWSGAYNGGAQAGPATYKAAFRHVVGLFRAEGADNVGFAFHANWRSDPDEPWNAMEAYYPGDAYVDWIGASAYGAVERGPWEPLPRALDEVYPKLAALSVTKPIALMETGVIAEQGKSKPSWISAAYAALRSGRYPRVKAVTWWHERWTNDAGVHDVRIDSDAPTTAAYRRAVASAKLVSRPRYACAPKG